METKTLTMKRKHYYGYASEKDKRFSSSEVSWSLEREDIGRTHCVRSATDCNLGVVLENEC
jgi:hypothetical protein